MEGLEDGGLAEREAIETAVIQELADQMLDRGVAPAKVHAFRRLGFAVIREALDEFSAADTARWRAAVDEWPGDRPRTRPLGFAFH